VTKPVQFDQSNLAII